MCRSSAAVIISRGKVLLVRRKPRKGDIFFWQVGFPGGGIKEGEDYIQAAVRETREEVGIELSEEDLKGELPCTYTLISRVGVKPLIFSLPEPMKPKPDGKEIEEARWVELSPKRGYALIPNKRICVPAFIMDGMVVWGLTYRILSLLLHSIGDILDPGGG